MAAFLSQPVFNPSRPSPAQCFALMQPGFWGSSQTASLAKGQCPRMAWGSQDPSCRALSPQGWEGAEQAGAGGNAGSEEEGEAGLLFVWAAAGFWEVRYLGSCLCSRCWRAPTPHSPPSLITRWPPPHRLHGAAGSGLPPFPFSLPLSLSFLLSPSSSS